jgi:hypothetical protein
MVENILNDWTRQYPKAIVVATCDNIIFIGPGPGTYLRRTVHREVPGPGLNNVKNTVFTSLEVLFVMSRQFFFLYGNGHSANEVPIEPFALSSHPYTGMIGSRINENEKKGRF